MKAKRREMWQQYFVHIAQMMELRDWRFTVVEEPSEEGAGASWNGYLGRQEADIRLSVDWETYPPEKQRAMAVHELTHSHLHEADMYVAQTAKQLSGKGRAGKKQTHLIYSTFDLLTEFAVERIAQCIAPRIPLPSEVVPELGQAEEEEEAEDTDKEEQDNG